MADSASSSFGLEDFAAILLACVIMVIGMFFVVAVSMPFHGAIVRLRANYNPKGVGLEQGESR